MSLPEGVTETLTEKNRFDVGTESEYIQGKGNMQSADNECELRTSLWLNIAKYNTEELSGQLGLDSRTRPHYTMNHIVPVKGSICS